MIEPTFEHERRILTIPGNDVAPCLRQAFGGRCAKEVTERGLTKPIEMFVCSQQHRRLVKLHARFLTNLADCCCGYGLASFDSTSGNLSARFRMIPMVEDEQAVFSLDVNDDATSHCHRLIVGPLAYKASRPNSGG